MDDSTTKRCTKCGAEKPLDQFKKRAQVPSGYSSHCKTCCAGFGRVYRQAHTKENREYQREYRLKNLDKTREQGRIRAQKPARRLTRRAWAQAHKDRFVAYSKKWRQQNIEQARAYGRKYGRENQARQTEQARKRRELWTPEQRQRDVESTRRWVQHNRARARANYHRYRAQKRSNGGTYTAEQWHALKTQYNHRCLRCGKPEPEVKLTVDHVLAISLGGSNDIANIQPLCWSCNSSKQATTTDYRLSPHPSCLLP